MEKGRTSSNIPHTLDSEEINMKYIAIEGSCYAGKTTTAEQLRQQGAYILKELRMRDGLPPNTPVPDGLEGYKMKVDATITAEEARMEEFKDVGSADLVVTDRTALLQTILPHDLAVCRGDDSPDREWAFEYGVKELEKARQLGRIILPDLVIVMGLNDQDEFNRRVAERGNSEVPFPPFDQYEPNRLLAERTYVYAKAVWGDSSAQVEVGPRNQKESVGARVLELIQTLPTLQQPSQLPQERLPY